MYHNGFKLIQGITGTITSTKSFNNSIVCNSTSNMIVESPIIFSDTMFGTIIVPQTVYYVKSILDDNQFTISTTKGGSTLILTDAHGGAEFITQDYSFGIQPNGIQTKIILAAQYNQSTDYLVYSLLGQTSPQFAYTIPETQYYDGDGATLVFNMDYNNGGSNPTNAIVEVNGLRVDDTQYTISDLLNTITFTSAPTGTVAVTTYNDTQRQYFNTQYGITNKSVSAITNISNTISNPLASTVASRSEEHTSELQSH